MTDSTPAVDDEDADKWEYSCLDCDAGVIRDQNPIKCPVCGGGPLIP